MAAVDVLVESSPRKTFVRALAWPGLARGAKHEADAVAALDDALPRYTAVLRRAGVPLGSLRGSPTWRVAERLPGGAGTDFGVPETVCEADRATLAGRELQRWVDVLEAAWAELDDVAATAPAVLRKGPRGGGRDTLPIVRHVAESEPGYARSFGTRMPTVKEDLDAHRAARLDLVALLRDPAAHPEGGRWPVRYLLHRMTWHVLDHVWEIQNRSSG